jgi:hypothetical protein
MNLLAYTPFIDPINVHSTWFWMLIPLSLGVSIVYKALRVGDMKQYPKQVLAMTTQIVIVMVALGIASYVLIQHVVPRILPVT